MVTWLATLATIASITLLVVAVVGRERGDEPTLRAMAAGNDMSNDEAHAVASNTVRVWMRERNAGHLANVEALTCRRDAAGTVVQEIDSLKKHEPGSIPVNIVATGGFARHGSAWTLNTHFASGVSFEFVLVVEDGELRVCRIASAPVP